MRYDRWWQYSFAVCLLLVFNVLTIRHPFSWKFSNRYEESTVHCAYHLRTDVVGIVAYSIYTSSGDFGYLLYHLPDNGQCLPIDVFLMKSLFGHHLPRPVRVHFMIFVWFLFNALTYVRSTTLVGRSAALVGVVIFGVPAYVGYQFTIIHSLLVIGFPSAFISKVGDMSRKYFDFLLVDIFYKGLIVLTTIAVLFCGVQLLKCQLYYNHCDCGSILGWPVDWLWFASSQTVPRMFLLVEWIFKCDNDVVLIVKQRPTVLL